jgi:uncharacterized protein (DUF58 family)
MTRAGIGAVVLGAALLTVGWLLTWSPVVVLGSILVVLLIVAFAYVIRPPQLRIERFLQPQRVSRDLPAIVVLNVVNRGRSRSPRTVALQPYGSSQVQIVLPKLEAGQTGTRAYRLPTHRRGVYDIGPLEVSVSDPFGLLRETKTHGVAEQLWVYPRVHAIQPLPSGVLRHLEGATTDLAPEGEITFHRLREYVRGDDLRMIHWKSTARIGKLMVRHNVDTSLSYTVVVVDIRPRSYSAETFELAMDAAASVVMASSEGMSAVQLRTTDGQQVGGPDCRLPQGLLDHLTSVAPQARGSIGETLRQLERDRGGTGLVVVTGMLDRADLPRLAALRRRFGRVVLASMSAEPQKPVRYPGLRVVMAKDGDEFCAAWNAEAAR